MKRRADILFFVFIVIAVAFLAVSQIFFSGVTSYYLAAAIVLVLSLLPFFIGFEQSAPSAREIALVSALIALAVASRAVFYLVPQFKPIGAVVVVSAVCLGARRGYIIGALSAFISNFLFGQGVWTPFQMVALGLVGFAAGILFKKIKANRWSLAVIGFLLSFVLYGLVADLSSVLTMLSEYTLSGVIAVYAAGAPFSAVFGAATALFLFLFGQAFIKKINRVVEKYGVLAGENHEKE